MLATTLVLSGCSVPKNTFVVSVPQNTKIEWSEQEQTNNDVKLTVSANEYVGFLVATDPRTGLRVPFGVDYKHKVYHGDGVMAGCGTVMTAAGAVSAIMGLAFFKEDEDLALGLFLPGFGVAGGGLPIAISGFQHQDLLSHDYKFTYVPRQIISFDGISSVLAHVDPPKQTPPESTLNHSKPKGASYSVKAPSKSSTSSKNKKYQPKDNAERVSGTYLGNVKIMEGVKTVETYPKATAELSRIDKSKVKITIKVQDENFYDDEAVEMIATVIPEKNGDFTLKLEGNFDAVIKVRKSKTLSISQKIYGPEGEEVVFSFSGNK